MYPSNYRGRQVTESNVQDYISNIVSKYLPQNLPPWQICVIPITNTTAIPRIDDTAVASTSDQSSGNDRDHQSTSDLSTVIKNKDFSAVRVSFACYKHFYTHHVYVSKHL